MIYISFIAGELIFTAVWLASRITVWLRSKSIDWKREALLLLMYVNLAVIIRMVFYPMDLVDGRVQPLEIDTSAFYPFWMNFKPLVHLFDYDEKRDALLNLIGNIALFIPSGIVLPVLYKKLDNFRKVTAAGALISLCIEIMQLPIACRASDVDDLILNTAGVAIGYGIYALVRALTRAVSNTNLR